MDAAADIYRAIAQNIARAIFGQDKSLRLILAALVADGHVLLDDNPGTGKTTLAKALARSIDSTFKRIQFTPDVLPSDITGLSIYQPKDQSFTFHPGPVFTQILLADEINRASPRTQSALLEAMAEKQVTVEGQLRPLDALFFVIATQNPLESHGTYPLPEAQMDRFAVQLSLGYLAPDQEMRVLTEQGAEHPLAQLQPVARSENILELRQAADKIALGEELKRYIVDLVTATRHHPAIKLGASTRASLTLKRLAQALALFDGLGYVTPDHVQEAAIPVVAHRLQLDAQARYAGTTGATVVADILATLTVPK